MKRPVCAMVWGALLLSGCQRDTTDTDTDTDLVDPCVEAVGTPIELDTPITATSEEQVWVYCTQGDEWVQAFTRFHDWDSSLDEIWATRPDGTVIQSEAFDLEGVLYLDEAGPWSITVRDSHLDYDMELQSFLSTGEPDSESSALVLSPRDDAATAFGVLLDAGDTDWVQVSRPFTGGPLEVHGSVTGDMALTVTVYDPDGVERARVEGVSLNDPHVVVFDGPPGDYLLQIEDVSENRDPDAWAVLWAITWGDWYTSRPTWEEEQNDTQATANPLVWDEYVSQIQGFFDPIDDEDWFSFSGTEGQWIQHSCTGTYDEGATAHAYDASGQALTWEPATSGFLERLALPTDGDYSLRMTNSGPYGPGVYWRCVLYLTDEPVFDGE